jgi:DMSO/TMAO reductase YedYZ molybdopterin-dependent catalytic subunit
MVSRRDFLTTTAGGLVLAGTGSLASALALAANPKFGPSELPSGMLESSLMDTLPGKVPLIKKTFRPPNYETPVSYFNEAFTPNNAFYVRYHLVNIPEVNARDWVLKVGGDAASNTMQFTLDELKKGFEQVEIAAVNQCSGNRRGLFQPHVRGVEWGYGAMGNATWRGVRLRDILNKIGVKKEAVEVVYNGADSGVIDKTPDFIKSLPVWKAMDENTLIAFEVNGAPLPHWNGFPARIVVPGWTGTYWVKHLTTIDVFSKPYDGFWMKTAYRIPVGKFPVVDRFISQETPANTPITEMVVNSLITNIEEGQKFRLGQTLEVKGIAWDGGYGIQLVEVSTDEGKTWRPAGLAKDLGRFAWRHWSYRIKPGAKGKHTIMAKATNRIGNTQTVELILNPAGYHHNVVQKIGIVVA